MLSSLAEGKVQLSTFADRYNFNPDVTFSDSFIAQVGSLNAEFFDALSSQSLSENPPRNSNNAPDSNSQIPASSQDSIDILLRHNTIRSLWDLMTQQFRETFVIDPSSSSKPHPSSSSPPSNPESRAETALTTRLSALLFASYIHPPSTHLGNKLFLHNPAKLFEYIAEEMRWWRGERKARGVEIHEVNSKCRRCEFLTECEWVKEKEGEVRERAEERRRSRV
jgi:exonuclease V